jgi:hypothetical protein
MNLDYNLCMYKMMVRCDKNPFIWELPSITNIGGKIDSRTLADIKMEPNSLEFSTTIIHKGFIGVKLLLGKVTKPWLLGGMAKNQHYPFCLTPAPFP